MKKILLLSFIIANVCQAANSPYENLAYALREQKIITDLKKKCFLPSDISDEKVRTLFLKDNASGNRVVKAFQYLKSGENSKYENEMAKVECPSI